MDIPETEYHLELESKHQLVLKESTSDLKYFGQMFL